jgi:hypothetical protein
MVIISWLGVIIFMVVLMYMCNKIITSFPDIIERYVSLRERLKREELKTEMLRVKLLNEQLKDPNKRRDILDHV